MAINRRRFLEGLAVTGAAVSVGCSSNGNDSGSPTGTSGAPRTQSDSLPNVASFSYPGGFGQNGITDSQTALESHRAYLMSLGSYTAEFIVDWSGGSGEESSQTRSLARVDTDEQVAYWEYSDHVHDKEVFFADGTLSLYSNRSNELVDPSGNSLFGGTPPEGFEQFATYFEGTIVPLFLGPMAFDPRGVTRVRGLPAVRYVPTGATSEAQESFVDPVGELLVVLPGGISSFNLSYGTEGQDTDRELSYELSNVDETTVNRPGWLD